MHRPEPDTDFDETLGALTDLVRQGKIRYIGTSTFEPSAIVEGQWIAERAAGNGWRPSSRRTPLLARGIEREVLPVAALRVGDAVGRRRPAAARTRSATARAPSSRAPSAPSACTNSLLAALAVPITVKLARAGRARGRGARPRRPRR